MRKITTTLAIMLAAASLAPTASAQDLLAGKQVYPLGDAKTWSNGDASYTFVTEDLAKLTATPQNTTNVYLYPENGAINNEENQAKGIQGFYVDLGESQTIATVSTTWEGAAADSYDIYLTDAEPTLDILNTTPTYQVTGLGQYTSNTAILPDGSKGRYLVFQATKATNWGWGVKIRSIKATAPAEAELTTFSVSPAIAAAGIGTDVILTFKDQNGLDIQANNVNVTVSDNATYANGKLTIKTGNAVFTAKMGDKTLTATVYSATAPEAPEASAIKTPVFTNTATEDNATAGWGIEYNGGAKNNGIITFSNDEVAQSFSNTRCVFFYNSVTTGAWNADINPTVMGFKTLHLDIYGTKDATGNVTFEQTTVIGNDHPFTLKAGEWTSVDVVLTGETKLHTMSVRFDEANMCDILLANIYFTTAVVEGDTEAPVLNSVSAKAGVTSVTLTLNATDNLNPEINYIIKDGNKTYTVAGKSGEDLTYTITGLDRIKDYTFTVVANDGQNVSEEKTVKDTTIALPENDKTPEHDADNVVAIYSSHYNTGIPNFDNWGSQATGGFANGINVLYFDNYNGQYGGLVGLTTNLEKLANHTDVKLYMDIYSDVDGELTIAPVWKNAMVQQVRVDTPNKKVSVEGGKWNHVEVPASEFAYPEYGHEIAQFSMSNSTLPSFHVDHLYFAGTPNDDKPTGVEEVATEEAAVVDVFNMQGMRVRHNVSRAEATLDLAPGIYIIGGKKVLVK